MSRELWEFKYSPKTFEDMILNEDTKPVLAKALDERPNMILHGGPGVGKGTFVNILIRKHGLQKCTLKINASAQTGIDTIRDTVVPFATAFTPGTLKLVYLNEADSLSSGPQGAQKALRDLIEQTYKNTQWILACNYVNNIIPELFSRCQEFHITAPPIKDIAKKCAQILSEEGVDFTPKALMELVKKTYPDIRNTLVTLRQNVVDGKLREKILRTSADKIFSEVVLAMRSKDPEQVRKVLRSNAVDYTALYEFLYNMVMEESEVFKNDVATVLLLGEHSHRHVTSNVPEINFMHMYFRMITEGVV